LLRTSENGVITLDQLNSTFRTREGKTAATEFLKEVGKKPGTSITTNKGFQILKPKAIESIKISKDEIAGFRPTPLGSVEYIKYVMEIQKNAWGNPPILTRNDYESFFRKNLGDRAKELATYLEKRLVEEGYVKPIKFGFMLMPEIKELAEFLKQNT